MNIGMRVLTIPWSVIAHTHIVHRQWVSLSPCSGDAFQDLDECTLALCMLPLTPHQDGFRQTEHHRGMGDGTILVRDINTA